MWTEARLGKLREGGCIICRWKAPARGPGSQGRHSPLCTHPSPSPLLDTPTWPAVQDPQPPQRVDPGHWRTMGSTLAHESLTGHAGGGGSESQKPWARYTIRVGRGGELSPRRRADPLPPPPSSARHPVVLHSCSGQGDPHGPAWGPCLGWGRGEWEWGQGGGVAHTLPTGTRWLC